MPLMKISIERNTDHNTSIFNPYFIHVEIGAKYLDRERHFKIPITSSGGVAYIAEICGVRLQSATIKDIAPQIRKVLTQMENMSRFPTYVFITERSRRIYPVYTIKNEVVAVAPEGVAFRHVELAKVREYLTDYLQRTGILGPIQRGDKLHIRGVHRETLRLKRPRFYLRKRAINKKHPEFWAPVFRSQTNEALYVYAVSQRHETELNHGREILELRQMVAESLIADNRLSANVKLRVERVMSEHWVSLTDSLTRLPLELVFHDNICFPIYQDNDLWIACEYYSSEDRYGLFFGASQPELQELTANDLLRRDMINSSEKLSYREVPV